MSGAIANARTHLALESAKEWIAAARHDERCPTVWVPRQAHPDETPEQQAQRAKVREELRKKPLPCGCWKAAALKEIAEILAGGAPTGSEVAA